MRFDGRRSIRLRNYDYSRAGAYFVTICTQNRACLFGEMLPNDAGKSIHDRWGRIAERYPGVSLGGFVIMPNHVHGVILINAPHPDEQDPSCAATLARIGQWFKTGTTYDYVQGVNGRSWVPFDRRLWQRNYYEHIIRNESEHGRIAAYIDANPSLWQNDALHLEAPEFQAKGHALQQRSPRDTG
jgi:REP element-mobilizing transposase RayT